MNRRDFFTHLGGFSVSAALLWYGWRQRPPAPTVSVRYPGLPEGHRLRDQTVPPKPDQYAQCETLILGSGAAALSAAWYLAKHGYHNFLIAEGFERNGNNAAYTYGSLKAPSGAHYLALPSRESVYVRSLLQDLGILLDDIDAPLPRYRETDLVFAPAERLFYQNHWQESLLPQNDSDSRRFFTHIAALKTARGNDGLKAFAVPIALSSRDTRYRQLDTLTFADWLAQNAYRSPTLLWYLDYCCRDDYGQGIRQVSAYAGLHYFAARNNPIDAVLTWPEGLTHLSEAVHRHIHLEEWQDCRKLNGAMAFRQPVSVPAAALHIREQDDGVTVLLHDGNGKTTQIQAKRVISAMPLAVAARVVESFQQYAGSSMLPESAPWLIGNFVLRSFPRETDHELAWDNVVYGSPALGYVNATNQLIHVAKPEAGIFTAYTALNHDTPANVRRYLLSADSDALLATATQDLITAYGKNFWLHVKHIDITVRGHGMTVPQPGYLNQPALQQLRAHRSRLLFAHSDLSGYSVFEEANYWGVQAAKYFLENKEF